MVKLVKLEKPERSSKAGKAQKAGSAWKLFKLEKLVKLEKLEKLHFIISYQYNNYIFRNFQKCLMLITRIELFRYCCYCCDRRLI